MLILPLYLTVASFLGCILGGKWIGIKGACTLTVTNIVLAALMSLYFLLVPSVEGKIYMLDVGRWISEDLLDVSYSLMYDALALNMLVVVTLVSSCAHFYSVEYMNGDPHQSRFMGYLSLFTFFMLILVTAKNLIQLFIGWEGVGICSYLLINFWYSRIKANKSAIMAVVVNKVGDIALLLMFGFVYYIFKSFDFYSIYSISNIWLWTNESSFSSELYILLLMVVLGAVGKSAQLGLHMWLPEAMEGPTPVSSLIHAATMVTAGIFLVIRCSYLIELVPEISLWIIFFGSLTTFFASTVGLFQNDLKKVVAYSTCSQLGYMFLACGLSGYGYSFFHLFNHAFFKALLFLTAGYIIHGLQGEQDMRKMGGMVKLLPFAYIMILVSSLSLAGFPFLSGFYSKEKILELFNIFYVKDMLGLESLNFIHTYSLIAHLAVIFTSFYSVRVLYLTFLTKYNGYKLSIHYGGIFVMVPLVLLFALTVMSGYLFKDLMIGVGTDYWGSSIYHETVSQLNVYVPYEFNHYVRNVTLYWGFYYLFLFTVVFLCNQKMFYSWKMSTTWAYSLFFTLTEKYVYVNKGIEKLSQWLVDFSSAVPYRLLDKGILELIGPFGVTKSIRSQVMRLEGISWRYLFIALYYFFVGVLVFVYVLI